MNITLKWDGNSGDGKRAFVVAQENDGWQDLRIEVDTDDCDRQHALTAMQEVMNRCNAAEVRVTPPLVPVDPIEECQKIAEKLDSALTALSAIAAQSSCPIAIEIASDEIRASTVRPA